MSNNDPINYRAFYCPYVPLQTSSVAGNTMLDLGLFIQGKHYHNVHSFMATMIRKELKTMKHFVIDMLP